MAMHCATIIGTETLFILFIDLYSTCPAVLQYLLKGWEVCHSVNIYVVVGNG